jgi:glutamyl-tRNA synthetase
LRLEDIDSPRVKPAAAAQALEDLRWLGLDWDVGPGDESVAGPLVQSQCLARYAHALHALRVADRIYPCTCTRTDVAAAASAPHLAQEGSRYPGTCAERTSWFVPEERHSWRFRTSNVRRTFHDAVHGVQWCAVSEELGDFVVSKVDGGPAYQLAVVCDDHAQGITDVVRGDDLIPSTFRQLELYDCFGWTAPNFAHVPLVVGEDGRRLAKRHGDTRLAWLREQGVAAEQLVGLLAWSCGMAETPAPLTPQALLPRFSWQFLPRKPFVFTTALLDQLLSTR